MNKALAKIIIRNALKKTNRTERAHVGMSNPVGNGTAGYTP